MDGMHHKIAVALKDLYDGLRRWELWSSLASRELLQGYFGSFFGRFWIALSLGIFILITGKMYSIIFKVDSAVYLPFLCSGLVCWRLITYMINEAASVFVKSAGYLKGFSLPVSIFVYRSLLKNLVIFSHYLLVYVLVAFIYSVDVNVYTLLFIPGLVILMLNSFWFVTLFGIFCTRFKDLQQLLSSFTILIFFVTPIFWPAEMIESHKKLVLLNPFYHLLEIVRAPLLGTAPDGLSWFVGLGIALCGILITIPVFAHFRSRVVYWV